MTGRQREAGSNKQRLRRWRARAQKCIPATIWFLALGLLGLAVAAFASAVGGVRSYLDLLSSFALIATFCVLMLYTLYTYRLAADSYRPLASFWLSAAGEKSTTVLFVIGNHCKRPLDCWCRLDATVVAVPHREITVPGFYKSEFPFYVQPFQNANGVFDIERDIANRAGLSLDDLVATEAQCGRASIHLKIRFGYGPTASEPEWLAPVYYYYSATLRRLVLDVGAVERSALKLPS
jgi:hypothetical protein